MEKQIRYVYKEVMYEHGFREYKDIADMFYNETKGGWEFVCCIRDFIFIFRRDEQIVDYFEDEEY